MERVDLGSMSPDVADLVGRAEMSGPVELVRDGKVVGLVSAASTVSATPKKKVDVEMLRRLAERMPYQEQSAGDFIREMRDEERY